MYTVTVSTDFVAQHFLTVPNCGPENELHSHRYRLDLELAGTTLDEHGYLVDIDEIRAHLSAFAGRYRDETLNERPAIEGNPSVERFARVACEFFDDRLPTDRLDRITATMWEDDVARASYALEP